MRHRLMTALLAIAVAGCSNFRTSPPSQPAAPPSASGPAAEGPVGAPESALQGEPHAAATAPEEPESASQELAPVAAVAKAVLFLGLFTLMLLVYFPYFFVR